MARPAQARAVIIVVSSGSEITRTAEAGTEARARPGLSPGPGGWSPDLELQPRTAWPVTTVVTRVS